MDDTRHTAVGSTAAARPSPLPLTERQEARRRRILEASTALACGGGFDAVQMREVAETSEVALGTLYRYFPSKVHLLVAVMEDQLSRLHATLRERPPASAAPSERVAETLLRAFRALQREPLLADAMVRAMIFADRSVSAEVDTVSRLTTTIIVDAAGGTAAGPVGRTAGAAAPGGTAHAAAPGRTAGAGTPGEAAGAGTPGGTAGAGAPGGAAGAATDRAAADAHGAVAAGVAGGPRAGGDGLDASAVRVIEHTWHAALVAWLSGRATVAQVTEDIRTACRLLDAPA